MYVVNFTLNAAELDKIAREAEAHAPAAVDPEPVYRQAAILAFCGKKEIAVSLLRTAIAEDYCALGALQSDPLIVKAAGSP